MAVVVSCPHCHTRLTLGDDRVGTTLECPRCDRPITIPSLQPGLLPVSGSPQPTNLLATSTASDNLLCLPCPHGSINAEHPGEVVGLEVVREQYVTATGSVSPVWGPNGPTSVRGYQETKTNYRYETRFFVRHINGREKFYTFQKRTSPSETATASQKSTFARRAGMRNCWLLCTTTTRK